MHHTFLAECKDLRDGIPRPLSVTDCKFLTAAEYSTLTAAFQNTPRQQASHIEMPPYVLSY